MIFLLAEPQLDAIHLCQLDEVGQLGRALTRLVLRDHGLAEAGTLCGDELAQAARFAGSAEDWPKRLVSMALI